MVLSGRPTDPRGRAGRFERATSAAAGPPPASGAAAAPAGPRRPAEITDEDHGRTRLHRRRGEPDRQCAAVQPRDNPPAAARQVAVGKQHQQVDPAGAWVTRVRRLMAATAGRRRAAAPGPYCHVIRGSHRRLARLCAQATAPPNGRQFPCRRRKLCAIAYSTIAHFCGKCDYWYKPYSLVQLLTGCLESAPGGLPRSPPVSERKSTA